MNRFLDALERFYTGPFFKYGAPFMVFMVGGSLALKQFTSIRYSVHRHTQQFGVTPELEEKMGLKMQIARDLDEEYKKMQEEIDINNWENIRGPRPYEDSEESIKLIEQRIQEIKRKKGAMSMSERIQQKKKAYEEEERKKLEEQRRIKEQRDEAYRKRLQETRALRTGKPLPEQSPETSVNNPSAGASPSSSPASVEKSEGKVSESNAS